MLASWHVPQKKMNITRVGQYSIVRIHNTARLLAHIERINYCILLTHNFSMSGESSAVLLRRHRRCGESRPRRRGDACSALVLLHRQAGRRRQASLRHRKRCAAAASHRSSETGPPLFPVGSDHSKSFIKSGPLHF